MTSLYPVKYRRYHMFSFRITTNSSQQLPAADMMKSLRNGDNNGHNLMDNWLLPSTSDISLYIWTPEQIIFSVSAPLHLCDRVSWSWRSDRRIKCFKPGSVWQHSASIKSAQILTKYMLHDMTCTTTMSMMKNKTTHMDTSPTGIPFSWPLSSNSTFESSALPQIPTKTVSVGLKFRYRMTHITLLMTGNNYVKLDTCI